MNYTQTLEYLFSRLPMFQRIGKAAYKADLVNTHALCKALGNPQQKLKTIHVAGTNGKGSVSHMLASIFQEAGYKTGLYTSPHLKDFRERIKINGKPISKKTVCTFVEKNKTTFEEISPSFFEWTVALAFQYFFEEKTDIAIIEVGLGGRLDSTNVITPELSVITNISFDHKQFLGNTLKKIAKEKAGIIKTNIPVVIGEKHKDTTPVFLVHAKSMHAPIIFSQDLQLPIFPCALKGSYQKKNIQTVLAAIQQVSNQWRITDYHVLNGLKNVVKNTGLKGRWQTLSRNPLVICDTAHNEAGIKEVMAQLLATSYHTLHIIFGVVNDKELHPILKLLPKDARYYFCQPEIPRALPSSSLKENASLYSLKGKAYPSVRNAISDANLKALANDLIFIGGSTFVVADALIFLKK